MPVLRVLPAVALMATLAACSSDGPPPADTTQASADAPPVAAGAYAPGTGPHPALPAPEKNLIPTVDIAPSVGWAEGAHPDACRRFLGERLRPRPRSSAHPVRAAERRRAGGRNQRAAETRRCQGHQGRGDEVGDEEGRRRRGQRPTASSCCATRMAMASPKRKPCSSKTSTRRSAWRWSATLSTSPTPMPCCKFPYAPGATSITTAPAKVADLPAGPINHHWTKSLVASARRQQALRRRRFQQQCRRERHRPRKPIAPR